jgi:predicted RNA binding protein YcfA (HicA-like mRNA interferase family)
MKRIHLIRQLERHGVQFLREGGSHSVFVNRAAGQTSTILRHREINDFLTQKICKDLEVPKPQVLWLLPVLELLVPVGSQGGREAAL